MIGLVVITHARLGRELVNAAEFILGKIEQVETVSVESNLEVDQLRRALTSALAKVDKGDGVLVLTDMFGATPGNIAARLLADGRVEGVSGLSLPMLVRALSGREGTLAAAVQRALSGGAEGVLHMNREPCRAQR